MQVASLVGGLLNGFAYGFVGQARWDSALDQVRGGGREEPLVEVVPDGFQVRVHAREW